MRTPRRVLDDVLACAYRLHPGAPHDEPIPSVSAFFEDIDAASAFYRHVLAQPRRRWAAEHASLWNTLGPSAGLKADHVIERVAFGHPTFVVSPGVAWPALVALHTAAALRRLAGERQRQGTAPHPGAPASASATGDDMAAEQLRELEQLGQRIYPRSLTYAEWLPSRKGRDTG